MTPPFLLLIAFKIMTSILHRAHGIRLDKNIVRQGERMAPRLATKD